MGFLVRLLLEFVAGVMEVIDEVLVALVALFGVLVDHLVDHVSRRAGNVRSERLDTDHLALEMFERHNGGGFGLKGGAAGQRVEEGCAQGIDVAAKVLGSAVELLRRHVVGRAPDVSSDFARLVHERRKAEVHDL